MGIHDEDVARVRDAVDIVAVIGEHVQLKRVGRRWQGLCPFHGEKTPSFSVNAEMGLYHCFGCKASGDAITFIREVEHADFGEAVDKLAGRAGIALRYTSPAEGADPSKRGALTEALEQAVEWYHRRLLSAEDAGPARSYLRERGYDGGVVARHKLGWAPDEWDALAADLGVGADKGMPERVFSDAGLGFRNKGGRVQDSFRARVLFPIFDPGGKPVGFGGRVLPGGDGPKYKNSADGPVYRKSRVLYGLNWAKQDIVNAGEVIVCEGYTDVIGCAQAGIRRAVATCGTALTEDHVRVLRRYAPRIVLAFDADSAGQAAAERFSQWEHAFDLEVAVADLPEGADPGDLARNDPRRLAAAVDGAADFMDFRIDRVLGGADLTTAKGQVRAGERAARLVAEHPNPAVRDKYLVGIADRCSMGADHLREVVAAGPRTGRARPAARPDSGGRDGGRSGRPGREADRPGAGGGGPPPHNVERQVLWLAAHVPGAVWPEVAPEMFAHPLYRGAFEALLAHQDMDALFAGADPAVAALIKALLVEEDEGMLSSERRQQAALAVLLYETARRDLDRLGREARSGAGGDGLLRRVASLKTAMDRLRESGWDAGRARELLEARSGAGG